MPKPNTATLAEIDVEVRYAETDQMGVVHHSNYIVWFELARTALCSQSGYHYADIEKLGYQLAVTKVEVRYGASAKYGQTVKVVCWLDHMSSRGLRFRYEVTHDGQRLVRGATEHVWIGEGGKVCQTPPVLKEPFAKLAAPAE